VGARHLRCGKQPDLANAAIVRLPDATDDESIRAPA
jgi:hypothetical protein